MLCSAAGSGRLVEHRIAAGAREGSGVEGAAGLQVVARRNLRDGLLFDAVRLRPLAALRASRRRLLLLGFGVGMIAALVLVLVLVLQHLLLLAVMLLLLLDVLRRVQVRAESFLLVDTLEAHVLRATFERWAHALRTGAGARVVEPNGGRLLLLLLLLLGTRVSRPPRERRRLPQRVQYAMQIAA